MTEVIPRIPYVFQNHTFEFEVPGKKALVLPHCIV
jgi:hypothetical protein